LQDIPAREFPMAHATQAPHGGYWTVTVPIAGAAPAVHQNGIAVIVDMVYGLGIDFPS
jgi:hypothetical protein